MLLEITKGVVKMKSNELKKQLERMAVKFTQLNDSEKSFIAGYIAGKEEERKKRKQSA